MINQKKNFTVVTGPTLAELQNAPLPKDYHSLTGPLPFTMTNDALFHIVFEANPDALKELVCSLLHLKPEEIDSIEVTNPIEFGNTIYTKSFILDLRIHLNNRTLINIEMQVVNLSFWKERSLGYLCRSFDNLNKGDSYANTKPAIHIGILDFEVFPKDTEFYATYHLANDRTHKIYSDNFRLSVLQLNQWSNATSEDKQYNLQHWAKLFKATTWEEIRMLAEQNPITAEIAKTIYRVTSDERIRQLCEAREEGEKTQRTLELLRREQEKEIQSQKQEIQSQQQVLQSQQQEIQSQQQVLQSQQQQLQDKDAVIKEQEAEIARLQALLNMK